MAVAQAAVILFAMTAATGCFWGPDPYWYHHHHHHDWYR